LGFVLIPILKEGTTIPGSKRMCGKRTQKVTPKGLSGRVLYSVERKRGFSDYAPPADRIVRGAARRTGRKSDLCV